MKRLIGFSYPQASLTFFRKRVKFKRESFLPFKSSGSTVNGRLTADWIGLDGMLDDIGWDSTTSNESEHDLRSRMNNLTG